MQEQRAQLLQARGVLTCVYEVLLHADGEQAVSCVEATCVAANLINENAEELDPVRIWPLIEALASGSDNSEICTSSEGRVCPTLPCMCVTCGEGLVDVHAIEATGDRRLKERKATNERFLNEVRQLSRSQHFPNLAETSAAVAAVFAESAQTEAAGLDSTISRILDCADVIPLTEEVMQHSIRIRDQRCRHDRTPKNKLTPARSVS